MKLIQYGVGESLSALKIVYIFFQQQTAIHIMDLNKVRNLHCYTLTAFSKTIHKLQATTLHRSRYEIMSMTEILS